MAKMGGHAEKVPLAPSGKIVEPCVPGHTVHTGWYAVVRAANTSTGHPSLLNIRTQVPFF